MFFKGPANYFYSPAASHSNFPQYKYRTNIEVQLYSTIKQQLLIVLERNTADDVCEEEKTNGFSLFP